MRLLYIVPGAMSKNMGSGEMERRVGLLREWAFAGTLVDIVDVDEGPASIESTYEEFLSVPGTLSRVVEAEKAGYNGVIIGCFGDPGVEAAREIASIPVVGPGEASMLTAAMLGHSFTVISVLDTLAPAMKKLCASAGVAGKLASVRAAGVPVLELARDREASLKKIVDAGKKAMEEDGADVLILGCMSMAFLGVSDHVQDILGIPVVNPAKVALKALESLVDIGLSHSKKAYPIPPKLRAGGATGEN